MRSWKERFLVENGGAYRIIKNLRYYVITYISLIRKIPLKEARGSESERLRMKRLTGETTRYREKRVTLREEVSVMEVYWQLILRAGCARFVGHDTLPSQRATGKPEERDVLRCPTESNVHPPLLSHSSMPIPPVYVPCRASLSAAGSVLFPSTSGTREMSINPIERVNVRQVALSFL